MQERDRWILEALEKCRFLTTKQLARLFFGKSTSAANKRLRKLLDGGLINVWMRRLEDQNIYSLSAKGAGLCSSATHRAAVPRGLDQVEHVLLINDTRVEFSLSLEHLRGALSWWRSDWELRVPGQPLIPDAMFGVWWPDQKETTFLLEADNATRSQRAFLEKLLRYLKGSMNEVVTHANFRGVLVVAQDQVWAERYRAVAVNAGVLLPVWFTQRSLLQRDFSGSIWRTPEDDQCHSLRGIVFRPYGKEEIVCARPSLPMVFGNE